VETFIGDNIEKRVSKVNIFFGSLYVLMNGGSENSRSDVTHRAVVYVQEHCDGFVTGNVEPF
jgi:hypothetical protein